MRRGISDLPLPRWLPNGDSFVGGPRRITSGPAESTRQSIAGGHIDHLSVVTTSLQPAGACTGE
jgi:hypothetical protein